MSTQDSSENIMLGASPQGSYSRSLEDNATSVAMGSSNRSIGANGSEGGGASTIDANGQAGGGAPTTEKEKSIATNDREGEGVPISGTNGLSGGRVSVNKPSKGPLLKANDSEGGGVLHLGTNGQSGGGASKTDNTSRIPELDEAVALEFGLPFPLEGSVEAYEEYYVRNINYDDETADDEDLSLLDIIEEEDDKDRTAADNEEEAEVKTPDQIEEWLGKGCGCPNKCTSKFKTEIIVQNRLNSQEMDQHCSDHINHLWISILGALNVLTTTTEDVETSNPERKYAKTKYLYRGVEVCKSFFLFIHNCSASRLTRLKSYLSTFGSSPQMHKNVGKGRSLPFERKADAVSFIDNFAEQHALVLPGRTPAHADFNAQLLPCSMTKKHVYDLYLQSCETLGNIPLKRTSWYNLWNEVRPNIVIQKPRTDLCPFCQANVLSLGSMYALSEEEKAERIQKCSIHLAVVKEEREYYTSFNKALVQEIEKQKDIALVVGPHLHCSLGMKMHYSFDFAQQIHLPHSSQQVGPLYFLTGYKVGLFGVAIEPLGKLVLYIIPESCTTGKGSNVVISLLHHFFENFAVGENEVVCHADNCSGQNKNNFLMQYICWRVLTGLHKSIQLSFLPVGHTKFAPDLNFGHFKKCFGKKEVNTLNDVLECAKLATPLTKAIIPFLVGDEKGTCHVKTYDWKKFFETFKAKTIPGLLQYSHFKTENKELGCMTLKKSCKEEIGICTKIFNLTDVSQFSRPEIITPAGLSYERKKYLFDKIRPYVTDIAKDILCPAPLTPETPEEHPDSVSERPETSGTVTEEGTETTSVEIDRPPTKEKAKRAKPTCSHCKLQGHQNQIRRAKGSIWYTCPKRREEEAANDRLDKSI